MLPRLLKLSKIHPYWLHVGCKLTPNWLRIFHVATKLAEIRFSMAVAGGKMAAMQPKWMHIQPKVSSSGLEDGQSWVTEHPNGAPFDPKCSIIITNFL